MNDTRTIIAAGVSASLSTYNGPCVIYVRCDDWTGLSATLQAVDPFTGDPADVVNESGEAITFDATSGNGQQAVLGGVEYVLSVTGVPVAPLYFTDRCVQAC